MVLSEEERGNNTAAFPSVKQPPRRGEHEFQSAPLAVQNAECASNLVLLQELFLGNNGSPEEVSVVTSPKNPHSTAEQSETGG